MVNLKITVHKVRCDYIFYDLFPDGILTLVPISMNNYKENITISLINLILIILPIYILLLTLCGYMQFNLVQ